MTLISSNELFPTAADVAAPILKLCGLKKNGLRPATSTDFFNIAANWTEERLAAKRYFTCDYDLAFAPCTPEPPQF